MKKGLSDKEKLFCAYFSWCRDGREAAAKSGYAAPKRAGAKLLSRSDIQTRIAELDKSAEISFADVLSGYRRLAFGCSADAISLLFDEDITKEKLESMDLYNIAEIKRVKDGVIQVKFFDRIKAMDKLGSYTQAKPEEKINELYDAIREGAEALKADDRPL